MAWGGARKGAGRKAKAAPSAEREPAIETAPPPPHAEPEPPPPSVAAETAADILDAVARQLYAAGNLVEASKAAARAEAARTRALALSQTPGKRQQRQDAAERASTGRFATPPAPGTRPN